MPRLSQPIPHFLLFSALLACDIKPEIEPTSTVRPGLAGLDDLGIRRVIVVQVDTLRADRLAAYGHDRDTLPAASDWLPVHGLHGSASWTLPSTASAMTGLFIAHHGLSHMTPTGANVNVEAETLGSWLTSHGVRTYLASGNEALQIQYGLVRDNDLPQAQLEGRAQRDTVPLVQGTLEWIDTLPEDQPFFAWIQPMDVHEPFHPGDHHGTYANPDDLPFDVSEGASEADQIDQFMEAASAAESQTERDQIVESLRDVYDECVLNVNDGIELLKRGLAERGLTNDTLIVITADHGETLGEDSLLYFGHGGTVRPELVELPLGFIHPKLSTEPVDCLSQNVDLAPTLLQAMGMPAMPNIDGQALQSSCREVVHSSTFVNNTTENRPAEMMASTGEVSVRWNCVENNARAYDLSYDPEELAPLTLDSVEGIEGLAAHLVGLEADFRDLLGADACLAAPK